MNGGDTQDLNITPQDFVNGGDTQDLNITPQDFVNGGILKISISHHKIL